MCIVPYGCFVHNYIFTGPIGDQGFYTHLCQGFMQNGKQGRPLSKECINIENKDVRENVKFSSGFIKLMLKLGLLICKAFSHGNC